MPDKTGAVVITITDVLYRCRRIPFPERLCHTHISNDVSVKCIHGMLRAGVWVLFCFITMLLRGSLLGRIKGKTLFLKYNEIRQKNVWIF